MEGKVANNTHNLQMRIARLARWLWSSKYGPGVGFFAAISIGAIGMLAGYSSRNIAIVFLAFGVAAIGLIVFGFAFFVRDAENIAHKKRAMPVELATLCSAIQGHFPDAQLKIDLNGPAWFLDIICRSKKIVLEWREGRGFGLSDVTNLKGLEGWGEGPDSVAATGDAAFVGVVALIEKQ